MLNRLVVRSGTYGINLLSLSDLEGGGGSNLLAFTLFDPAGVGIVGIVLTEGDASHHPRLSMVEPLRGSTATS